MKVSTYILIGVAVILLTVGVFWQTEVSNESAQSEQSRELNAEEPVETGNERIELEFSPTSVSQTVFNAQPDSTELKDFRSRWSQPQPALRIESVRVTPPSLLTIMGKGQNKGYVGRLKEARRLGDDLSAMEIQTLYVLLNRKKGEDNLRLSRLNALKNDVVNALRRQKTLHPDLANNLRAMYYDKEHDNVWRDYCIQHLGGIYDKAIGKQEIAETFWDATRETDLGIAGTALIALATNYDGAEIKKSEVADKALELSTSSSCGELAKITALQICAQLNEKRVLPAARKIASSRRPVPLRISAIAAVGTLGDESDREMLEEYTRSRDVRLRKSAKSALGRLEG